MTKMELLGKNCKDIVSGFEGICIGVVEWMYGCSQYILQAKAEVSNKKGFSSTFLEKQLEVVDDGIRDKVEVPSYQEQKFFGKECRDKVTGVKGICVGRTIWLFNCDQYILEIQPEDPSKEARVVWLDDGRVEETKEQKHQVDPGEIQGTRSGGPMDASFYPGRRTDLRQNEVKTVF